MNKNDNQQENNLDKKIDNTNKDSSFDTQNNHSEPTENIQSVIEDLENQLKFAKAEAEDWKSHSTRLSADLQNLTKQHQLDITTAKKSAKKKTISAVLNFLNTLNLAFAFAPKSEDLNIQKFVDTLKISFEKIIEDLKVDGIEIITPKIGEEFNPSYMSLLNGTSGIENPVIQQVVSLGLKVDGSLVQPAAVMV